MAIALMTTVIATSATDTQYATIMKKRLSAMGMGWTVETIAKEGKWWGECWMDHGIVGLIFVGHLLSWLK